MHTSIKLKELNNNINTNIMAIEIGSYLTPELKEYINTFVSVDERKKILTNYSFSRELERQILNGDNRITENTHSYVIDLVKIAVRNRTKKLPQLNQTHKMIKDIA